MTVSKSERRTMALVTFVATSTAPSRLAVTLSGDWITVSMVDTETTTRTVHAPETLSTLYRQQAPQIQLSRCYSNGVEGC